MKTLSENDHQRASTLGADDAEVSDSNGGRQKNLLEVWSAVMSDQARDDYESSSGIALQDSYTFGWMSWA